MCKESYTFSYWKLSYCFQVFLGPVTGESEKNLSTSWCGATEAAWPVFPHSGQDAHYPPVKLTQSEEEWTLIPL